MSKAEWGLKRVCPSCGARYYDMKKNPPVCPSCSTTFDPENLMRTRRGRAAPKPAPEEVIEDLPVVDGDDAEDALIEDAEELADDDEVLDVEETQEDA
ncbi:MAG: TIGR02300 family protein [Alphaproteobacteria bacterium]|nr:TIGR02300 family protein [Alphaproteobacteria bacterium]